MTAAVPFAAGALALILATVIGGGANAVDFLATPPALVRAVLVAGALVVGLWLLGQAVDRIGRSSSQDLRGMVRGIRFVFLAIAAFAAAGGWIVGNPLPLVVALVIAGVDVVETSFLLLVVSLRHEADERR